jgi:hypothetical protein
MGQSASRARSGQRLRYADGSGEQLAKNRISGQCIPISHALPSRNNRRVKDFRFFQTQFLRLYTASIASTKQEAVVSSLILITQDFIHYMSLFLGQLLGRSKIQLCTLLGPPKSAEAPVDGAMDVRAAQAAAQPDREKNAAVDAMRKDPVLSSFLDQLGGSVAKRQVQEYYGEGIPVTPTYLKFTHHKFYYNSPDLPSLHHSHRRACKVRRKLIMM